MFLYFKGELIRVEYLYDQTGKVLQDYNLAIEESETSDFSVEGDERHAELEEFQDITVPTFETERTPAASSQALASVVPPSPVPTRPASCTVATTSVVPPSPAPTRPASCTIATADLPAVEESIPHDVKNPFFKCIFTFVNKI